MPFPRCPTLEELDELADVVRAGGIEVTVRYETPDTLLPADVGHAAYRILQEALTNVLRHSGAHRAEVTISRDEGHLTLTVSDDGRGPGDGAVRGAGYGLTGMRERAASVGGSLQFGPNRSGGFVVKALLPFAGSS